MALETATYISDLVSTNPTASDNISAGDDHIRLLKSSLKSTFPNVTGAVTADHTELNKLDGLLASTAELNFVDGVTSAIQTQLNDLSSLKAPLASPTFTGTVVLPSSTSVGNVSSTELGYLDGVTSALQTQLDAKAPLASPALTGTPTAPTAANYTNTTQIATTAQVYDTVSTLPYNYQGSSYTLAASDRGKIVLMDNTSTLTIPTYASVAIPVSSRIDVAAWSSGVITISAASGVTLRSSGSKVKLSGPFSGATLIHMNLNEWLLIGDIA